MDNSYGKFGDCVLAVMVFMMQTDRLAQLHILYNNYLGLLFCKNRFTVSPSLYRIHHSLYRCMAFVGVSNNTK